MNIKKIHFILVFLMFCSLSISGTYASTASVMDNLTSSNNTQVTASSYAAASSVSVENHLKTGDINIQLDEFQLGKDLKEEPYDPPEILMPGDIISKIPRVTNLAEPCYIRAKISFPSSIEDVIPPVVEDAPDTDNMFSSTEDNTSADNNSTGSISSQDNPYCLSEKDILGLSADWVKIQDYYYYRPILEKEESVILFEGVRIPEYWDNTYASADFFIDLQIEAVQAIHFTPDYTSDKPWGNTKAEVCIHNEPYEKPAVGFQLLSVEYEGTSKELLAAPEDFFSNFTHAMPGDTLTDTITLTNTTDQTAEFFFRTEVPESMSNQQLALLNEIVLSISVDGKALYFGNLFAESMAADISLGTFESGASREFTFTIEIPNYWTNSYALQDCTVKWIFSIMPEPTPQPEPVISLVPRTGDIQMSEAYILAAIGSISCVVLIWRFRKAKRRARL